MVTGTGVHDPVVAASVLARVWNTLERRHEPDLRLLLGITKRLVWHRSERRLSSIAQTWAEEARC
jgi:hypothetical protein